MYCHIYLVCYVQVPEKTTPPVAPPSVPSTAGTSIAVSSHTASSAKTTPPNAVAPPSVPSTTGASSAVSSHTASSVKCVTNAGPVFATSTTVPSTAVTNNAVPSYIALPDNTGPGSFSGVDNNSV